MTGWQVSGMGVSNVLKANYPSSVCHRRCKNVNSTSTDWEFHRACRNLMPFTENERGTGWGEVRVCI